MDQQSNLAYEYERFEDHAPRGIQSLQGKKKQAQKRKSIVKNAGYVVMAVVMISMLIYSRVEQTELNMAYNQTVADIEAKKGENARLKVELEEKLSLNNIEEYAENNLEMTSRSRQQETYINFNTENKVEVVQKQSFFGNIASWFRNLFS